jgi:succinoglycan biosynthesis protein ExoM
LNSPNELLLVGVCTYMRPTMLSLLLEACGKLKAISGLRTELLIVDNDPAGSARPVAEAARQSCPMPIHYVIEPARGIANARNRVLTEAISLGSRYLAFIDDDEMMKPDWLSELHATMSETGADAVGAPVYWELRENAPAWVHALPVSPEYERLFGHRKKRNKRWLYPSTNNVLMKARIFDELGIRFDIRFGMSGGEDTDFFLRAKAAGARYAFTQKAAVLEHVPASRLTLKWRFSRWAGVARGNVRMYRLHHGQKAAWKHYLPRSLPKLITGPVLLLAAPFAGPEMLLRGLKHLGGGLGVMQELLGYKSEEYRTIHGS